MKALRVLVVEDDPLIGMLLAETLEDLGYDVCAIETTEANAVSAATRCSPELMIVDARLGEGSGIAAVATIHRTTPTPCVFVSADISGVLAIDPAAVAIQKPYRELDLVRAIRRALGRAGSVPILSAVR